MSSEPAIDTATKINKIRQKAIDLVSEAIEDEGIPAAKRAEMALSLLGKQAIKDHTEAPAEAAEPVEIIFRITGPDGKIMPDPNFSSEHTEVK